MIAERRWLIASRLRYDGLCVLARIDASDDCPLLLIVERASGGALGPISLAAGVQIAASIPNFLAQEQENLGDGYLKKPFVVRNGYLELPTGPGLGIELDEDAMASKIGHDFKNPEAYDADDGSVMDW